MSRIIASPSPAAVSLGYRSISVTGGEDGNYVDFPRKSLNVHTGSSRVRDTSQHLADSIKSKKSK